MGSWIHKALLPGLISFALSLALYPSFIAYLKRQPWRREVREDVPETHLAKTGTPAMGGALFVVVTLIVALPLVLLTRGNWSLPAATLVLFAWVGLVDDYAKATGNRAGTRARSKLAFQIAGSVLLALWALTLNRAGMLSVVLPFGGGYVYIGWYAFVIAVVLLVGVANAANLNDGMDGLCSGLTVIALAAFGVLAAHDGRTDLVVFCSALGGAVLGFLRYNAHPASIFMGDTGSQALGAVVAMIAILLKKELWLAFICLPWLVDTLSVMMQVTYFKITKRLSGEGKRIFPITPIHHAFEKAGWSEWKVCALFWTVGAISATAAVVWG